LAFPAAVTSVCAGFADSVRPAAGCFGDKGMSFGLDFGTRSRASSAAASLLAAEASPHG